MLKQTRVVEIKWCLSDFKIRVKGTSLKLQSTLGCMPAFHLERTSKDFFQIFKTSEEQPGIKQWKDQSQLFWLESKGLGITDDTEAMAYVYTQVVLNLSPFT